MFQHTISDQFLRTLSHLGRGHLTLTMPDGRKHVFAGTQAGATADMVIHDARTIQAIAAKGDIGLAEAYREGWWYSTDLTALLLLALQNEKELDRYIYGRAFSRLISRFIYMFTRNTMHGSRRNIHAHYDLGNDFYELWLDPGMSYSSALFQSPDETLLQAQYNKYDRMLERLDARSGNMLEIGCGWGALAERAVGQYDFDVKGITLSEQQRDYAHARLGQNAHIALEDYRIQDGKYHHIVSVEMFEAVGEKFWPVYFGKLKSLLADKGKAMVQTITIGETYFDRYRKGGDMIRSFIFPGGMLPTETHFRMHAEKEDMRVTDSYAFGQDYARTLQHWLEAFEQKLPQIRTIGFDEPFIRMWRFYLAACIASFTVGRTDVMQLELQHA